MLKKKERELISESVETSEKNSLELQKIIIKLNEDLGVDESTLEEEALLKQLDLDIVKP